jgi:hypothetical protein
MNSELEANFRVERFPGCPTPRIGRRTLDRFHGFPEMRGMPRGSRCSANAANARSVRLCQSSADDQLAQLRAAMRPRTPFHGSGWERRAGCWGTNRRLQQPATADFAIPNT